MRSIGIIPSRWQSSRFPGKPLIQLGSKTMIQRVYEQAQKASLNELVVATDDKRIYDTVISFGGKATMTSSQHPSGTDRCWEAVQQQKEQFDAVINIQGDEPFVHPHQIQKLIHCLEYDEVQIATLAKKIEKAETIADINTPKIFFDQQMNASTFERDVSHKTDKCFYKHIGLYGYKTTILKQITALAPTHNEKTKRLEQMRWLDHDYNLRVAITEKESISIDSPQDIKKINHLL